MKYPQLVPTRAVNAISDWLVSRLEQLGVDAPQIYTRLLLSLLQSSVQINDPIEFSNLETFFVNRKGSNKRLLSCDTDTLKKLNAIQCLREIVSSEQEITTIENLVDDLCEKLKDVEKQSTDIENKDKLLVATISVPNCHLLQHPHVPHHPYNNFNKHYKKEERRYTIGATTEEVLTNTARVADFESDPKKRYFRAFPALSKEMEDSFRVWRQNAKALTWPINGANGVTSISSDIPNSILSKSDRFGARGILSGPKDCITTKMKVINNSNACLNGNQKQNMNIENCDNSAYNSSGVKKKSKRRRNQAFSKSKTIQNIRKHSVGNNAGGGNSFVGGKYQRNSSPSYWDTDFKGCWEMGRDLIKEFIVQQNKNKRNRSTSESAACNMKVIPKANRYTIQAGLKEHCGYESNAEKVSKFSSPLLPVLDISFCCDDEYDEADTSVFEVPTNFILSNSNHQNHYQRDYGRTYSSYMQNEDIISNDQLDFAEFKAKFNSNVEALWKDAESTDPSTTSTFPMHSSNQQAATIPDTVSLFKEDLRNFWINYYNHHFDLNKMSQEPKNGSNNFPKRDENNLNLMCNNSSLSYNSEKVNSNNEYYSMPNNLNDINRSTNNREEELSTGADNEQYIPINVFLQNSIWSENTNGMTADTDESFYFKVWNSAKKSNQLNDVRESMITNENSNASENNFNVTPYNTLKWSEGINAGPKIQHHIGSTSIKTNNADVSEVHNMNIDCTNRNAASSRTAISCSSKYIQTSDPYSLNWQTSTLCENLQVDMQSWSQSNPMSLTEMYGANRFVNTSNTLDLLESKITLPNHSINSSFIEYARIKPASNVSNMKSIIYATKPLRPKQCYAEGENLLTSEHTHFHPIKTYSDGHTFDICSAYDIIDYERSESGCIYWESEKYLEYTRNDNLTADDDVFSAAISGTPLYASSNCEAAAHTRNRMNRMCKNNNDSKFIIKFRVRNCEIACQTESDIEQIPIRSINDRITENRTAKLQFLAESTNDINGHSIIAPSGNSTMQDLKDTVSSGIHLESGNNLMKNGTVGTSANGPNRYSSIWTAVQAPLVHETCDDVDIYGNTDTDNESLRSHSILDQQWSMCEVGKKCRVNSLWGMCAACNSEFKSVPANRLLRDELQLEADEIMSDLRYMQDLYIGEAEEMNNSSDWEVEDEQDEKEKVRSHLDLDLIYKRALENRKHQAANARETIIYRSGGGDCLKNNNCKRQPQTQEVLQKVNRLIADLLRPDNVLKNINLTEGPVLALDNSYTEFNGIDGNLWLENGERNIWQRSESGAKAIKPMELLRHFNINPHVNKCENQEEDDAFLTQLNWKHNNLAEIWQKSTPISVADTKVSHKIIRNVNDSNIQIIKYADDEFEDTVADKNYKNLQTTLETNTTTSPTVTSVLNNTAERFKTQATSAASITTSAYKRVQQFFNTNASGNVNSKLKLPNRKRRHSASQNYFQNQQIAVSTNNNNVHVVDMNNLNYKPNSLNLSSTFKHDIEMQKLINSSLQAFAKKSSLNKEANVNANANDGINIGIGIEVDDDSRIYERNDEDFAQSKQTIITCKYWATIDPMSNADNVVESMGTTFSCLIDKNASILKHVTMVTRPLTR